MKQLPPSFILCPIFDDVNKWNFFLPPSLPNRQMSHSGQFFFKGIPNNACMDDDMDGYLSHETCIETEHATDPCDLMLHQL